MKAVALIVSLLVTISCAAQFQVDSAFVYVDLVRGGTTAGVSYHFKMADSLDTESKWLSTLELADLNRFLNSGKEKKHWQQKFGIENQYLIGFVSGREERILLASGSKIVNLSTYREYRFSDEQARELKLFFEKLKSQTTTTGDTR
jgi:hypothetical protein